MKLNPEHAAGFTAYVRKQVRRDLCKERENVSTTVMNSVLWIAMNVCFTTGSLNRTFRICQRSIAKTTGRSERWIYTVMKKLKSAGYLDKVSQVIYKKDSFGPSIYRFGPKLKALYWAYVKLNPVTYTEYIRKKWASFSNRKQTSDINLKKDTTILVSNPVLTPYSFIPDIRSFIKGLG